MLDRTHAEPGLTRVAQTSCDWSQFTVKCVIVPRQGDGELWEYRRL